MNQFVKALKKYKMVEPVWNNLFEVRFKSTALKYQDAVLLTEQIVRFGYNNSSQTLQNQFGIDFGAQFNTIDITFNQNVIDKRIEPLATLERLKDALSNEDKPAKLDINLYIHDKEGDVLRKVSFFGCKFRSLDPGTEFDYASQDIMELYLTLTYDSYKAYNNE